MPSHQALFHPLGGRHWGQVLNANNGGTLGDLLAEFRGAQDRDYIVSHVLTCSRTWLYAHDDLSISQGLHQQVAKLIQLRNKGVPLPYLTGEKEFFSLNFKVPPGVFIPRPETETIVELVKGYCLRLQPKPLTLLDLGTGCGNIGICIGHIFKDMQITATDSCPKAVAAARRNAYLLKTTNISVVHSNWWEKITGKFSVIVSNPPYIGRQDKRICSSVKKHEPHSALFANEEGRGDMRRIIEVAADFTPQGGMLVLEHGTEQDSWVCSQLKKGGFGNVKCTLDIQRFPRISVGYRR